MADSCRPVSRHGRYNSSGPSSVQYGGNVATYGNFDYTPTDEMYTVNQPERPERPKTSRGHRRHENPPRPVSRRSRKDTNDEESFGRPVSRVGFSPESSYRYSHDEYSRQVSSDNERQIQNSPCDSQEILYRDDEYFNNQKALYAQSPSQTSNNVDRLIVSPTAPQDILGGQSTQCSRKTSGGSGNKTTYGYSESPKSYSKSPQGYRNSPQNYQQGSQYESPYNRPTSREYVNVSPLQRDEAQIDSRSLHHDVIDSRYQQEGDAYQQRFADSTSMRSSPYRDSPYQQRDSPYHTGDSQYYGSSPANRAYGHSGSPDGHNRPPPVPRPKSARPKTAGRRKSARVRQRHSYQDQETSLPQQCDTSSILNTGDPYGRPSSSLSPYKPLPAIGVITPRDPDPSDSNHESLGRSMNSSGEGVTVRTQKLSLSEQDSYHPADDDTDIFTAEDIQGTGEENLTPYTGHGVPNVDELTNVPQHLSDEIYQSSLANFEENNKAYSASDYLGRYTFEKDSEKQSSSNVNSPSSVPKPLDFLHEIDDEPTENEMRLLLAIKLPDGKRIQRYFRPTDNLETVMHFAENSNLASYQDYRLICNAPRTTFTDLNVKICDTQIKDRTVLYLEESD